MKEQNDLKEIEENMKQVYEDNAKTFDQQRGKSLFEKKWLDLFLQTLEEKSNILDIGCGSGDPIAKYFIKNGNQVTGIDFSSSMIELAKERYPSQKWMIADMRDFNLNQKFDGIIAWNSFFHLNHEDQKKALKTFSIHLNDNGALMFTAGPEHGEVAGEVAGEVNGQPVYHSSFSVEEYREILTVLEIEIIEYKLNDSECNGHCIFLGKKTKKKAR